MGFRKGEQVVAVRDIGGIMRDPVPKGSQGIVVDCGWATPTKVQFTVKRPVLDGQEGHDRRERRRDSLIIPQWAPPGRGRLASKSAIGVGTRVNHRDVKAAAMCMAVLMADPHVSVPGDFGVTVPDAAHALYGGTVSVEVVVALHWDAPCVSFGAPLPSES